MYRQFNLFGRPVDSKGVATTAAKKRCVDSESEAKTKKAYEGKRHRLVHDSWLQEFEWLEYSQDREVMWCRVCRKYPTLADTTSNYFKQPGVAGDTKRYKSLVLHNKSEKHVQCASKEKADEQPKATPIFRALTFMKQQDRARMRILFNTAYFCAKEELAFTKYVGICKLEQKNGLEFGENYINDKQAAYFSKIIAASLKDKLSEMLKEANFISVLSDGSTDKTITEEEIVYVRFVDRSVGIPITHYVDLIELKSAAAPGVKEAIEKALDNIGIGKGDLKEKLVGLNMDGASVNMGKYNGVAALFKREFPPVITIHCVAHKLELGVHDAVKNENYIKGRFEESFKGIIKIYQYSPKLRRGLQEMAAFIDSVTVEYGTVQQIRWISSSLRALRAFRKNYATCVLHLEDNAHSQDTNIQTARSKGYLKNIKTVKFMKVTHFLEDLMEVLSKLSKSFQSDSLLLIEIPEHVDSALLSMEQLRTYPGENLQSFQDQFRNGDNVFQGIKLIGNETDGDSCINDFIDDCISYIRRRFEVFNDGILGAFQALNFREWPLETKDLASFGNDEIRQLIDHYAGLFAPETADNLQKQWADFKASINRIRKNNSNIFKVYSSLLAETPPYLSGITKLVEVMFCLSPSTAACERGFSTMNRIKISGRASLKPETLASLMRISIDGPSLHDFDPDEAVNIWHQDGVGTRHLGGHKLWSKKADEDVRKGPED